MDFLDLLVDFYISFFPDKKGKEKEIKYAFAGHYQYGTIDFDADKDGFIYLVRFNIGQESAEIIDFCIRKDFRNKISFKRIILKNWARFPWVKKICFIREIKYPEKQRKEYEISKFINI